MTLLEYVARPAGDIDLARAALLLARDEYPDLDIEHYLVRLDDLARDVAVSLFGPLEPAALDTALRTRLDQDPGTVIAALADRLFEHEGFNGNTGDYYDPRNSFLNDVLERRTGIPITLSIVYMAVARRLGLDVAPISFPSHFLVRVNVKRMDLVVDPFNAGTLLNRESLIQHLVRLFGDRGTAEAYLPQALISVPANEVVARMLRNLKAIYISRKVWDRALSMADQLVRLDPSQAHELRDRGQLYEVLECPQAALDDYRRYLEQQPDASDAAAIQRRMVEVGKLVSRLN
ncbi:MAG: tetratricopeptide repeat protein [Gammaproteobacteria bacterium]|nr:tetratricopeptide repeat protein [Gammaproteobacteria bacterium]